MHFDRTWVAGEASILQPLRWKAPRTIFVNSTSDLFHGDLPDEVIDRVFAVMALCPQHTFQVLTKRPERMRAYLKGDRWADGHASERIGYRASEISECGEGMGDPRWVASLIYGPTPDHPAVAFPRMEAWPLPNVWLGTSVEDQATADARIPHLLQTPAAIRFISAEPLLGAVDLQPWLNWPDGGTELPDGSPFGCYGCDGETACKCPRDRAIYSEDIGPRDATGCPEYVHCERQTLAWVICGGESGPGARPMHPDWARSLREQCAAADVPFFFKQWGRWLPICQDQGGSWDWGDAEERQILHYWDADSPCGASMPLSKGRAGRLLDGVTHDAMPHARRMEQA